MPDYDFQSLSSFDFQALSRDLIQRHLGIVLESFGPGRDKGVDFRLRDPAGTLVIQCKHYKDYASLLQVLKIHEIGKVKQLDPQRYLLSLSISLSPARKDEIFSLFAPYCQSESDIFGREDLNNLLGLYPEIERKNIKLWLTNTAILEQFINVAVWNDTALTLQRLKQKARLYVPNQSRTRVRKVLDQHHYCIVAGIPGIGKTTLAEVLLIEYANKHGYQAIRIANDLSEIRGVKDPAQKQIFYFDDFLGTTSVDRIQKNEDKRLVEFIEEVRTNDNWRFLLTTREYILNAAKIKYESLARPVIDLSPCIIELSDYTYPIRAKILYNHIYFSDLPDAYKRSLLEQKRYEKIIHHQNYNPRIVEYMTLAQNVKGISPNLYFEAFVKNLVDPIMVWDHAFRNQLSEAGQHLVLVMGTLADEIRLQDLETAFRSFYSFRQRKLGFSTRSRDFENALKELDGNFIKTSLAGQERLVSLHNPSLSDFLEHYFSNNPAELMDLVGGVAFFDQFIHLWRGRRGKKYRAFEGAGGDKLLEEVASKIDAPMSSLVRFRESADSFAMGVRTQVMPFEARVSFVIEVNESLKSPSARKLQDDLLDQLKSLLRSKRGNKEHLIRLLKKLENFDTEKLRGLPDAAKVYLFALNQQSTLDEFEAAVEFAGIFPKLVTQEDLLCAQEPFKQFCDEYDDSWADSPDDLLDVANRIDEVGSILGVDVLNLCTNLANRASEWDSEIPDQEEEEDGGDEAWEHGPSPPDETSEMFESLLEELNESNFPK